MLCGVETIDHPWRKLKLKLKSKQQKSEKTVPNRAELLSPMCSSKWSQIVALFIGGFAK